jgi:peptidoglycan/xylan/chitin deacetylase (PgdA/CDA1 family)
MAEAEYPNDLPRVAADATADEIVAAAHRVRAGRILAPDAWPGDARLAVCITVDVDNEFPHLHTTDARPVALSSGEYGAVTGLPRLLRVLDERAVPGTFFIPGGSLVLHPEMSEAIQRAGTHEIGVHGWTHEYLPLLRDADQERELLERSVDYLTRATGTRPVGFRAPSWEFGTDTLDLIRAAGFAYDSSMMARDAPYELLAHGEPTGMLELPIHWALDDAVYFGLRSDGSLPDPEAAFGVFRAEFDAAYEEGGLYVLTLHSMISGLRSRAAALDRLLLHMRGHSSVWFATMRDVAAHVRVSAGWPQ